jgi:aspartate carbamoyltransferase catalytic subunit
MWTRRHLLGLEELTAGEIVAILDRARTYRFLAPCTTGARRHDALAGKTVVLLFFEPSTRTACSFGLAAKRLSAEVLSFSNSASSTAKGETLLDTVLNLQAMGVDVFVIRHSAAGAAHLVARDSRITACVVNAGDGAHEHPTQGLLDVFTMREKKGRVEGLKVAIVGDIAHSRVARSNIFALTRLGADVTVCGPAVLVSERWSELGVKVSHDLDRIIGEMDVVNVLRIQRERLRGEVLPSDHEYTRLFGLTRERERKLKADALVMHPGPMNRGVEIASEVADGPHSVILEQVANGVAVRMAVLSMVTAARAPV